MMATDSYLRSNDVDEKKISMFDVIEENNRINGKKGIIHSMVVIARLREEVELDLPAYYDKFFKEVQAQTLSEGATGLILLFPTLCVHVVEASQEVLLEFVRDLRRHLRMGHESKIEDAKILVISHNIAKRLYSAYYHSTVDMLMMELSSFSPNESDEKIVTDVAIQIVKLSYHVHRKELESSIESQELESLESEVPELIPQQVMIDYLLKNNISCITLPDEYLHMYEVPYDVHLASDFVWPLPLRILPYH